MSRTIVSLGELFDVGSSKRVLKSQWKSDGVPFFRGREITRLAADGYVNNELFISESDYEEYALRYGVPRAGDIMVTAIGTIGNSYIVNEGDRFYFKDASVLWLKKRATVISEFVNYWLKSPGFFGQLDRGNGATVDTLTIGKLQSVSLELPPLAEQQRIVAFLDEAFAGIATARANAEKNLQNARALFESHLNAVFTQGSQSVAEGRGEGWVETTIGKSCKIASGGTPSKSNSTYWDGNIPWVSAKDLKSDRISDGLLHISEIAIKNSATKMAPIGSLLILVRGMGLANGVPIAEVTAPVAFNQDIRALVLPNTIVPRFLLLSLKSSLMRADAENLLSTSAHGTLKIDADKLRGVVFQYPSTSEQAEIVSKLDTICKETVRLESIYRLKIAALEELKKSLLHEAFSMDN